MTYQTIFQLAGLGQVYEEQKPVADVRYSLKVGQDYFPPDNTTAMRRFPGKKLVLGWFVVLAGEKNYQCPSDVALQLDDGSCWRLKVVDGDPESGQYRVFTRE